MRRPLVVLLAAAVLVVAACGNDSPADETQATPPRPPTKTEAPGKTEKPGPELCLLRAEASNVEHPARAVWRGQTDSGTLIRIERFPTRPEARLAVEAAELAVAKQAGRYAVFGGASDSDEEPVSVVADCLKAG